VTTRWRPRFNLPFTSLRNADYVTVVRQLNGKMLMGMIEIKTHFPYQNKVLINGFQHDFKLDQDVAIEFLEAEGTEPIYNEEGAYLFSLDFSESRQEHKGFKAIAVFSLAGFIVLLFAAFCEILKSASRKGRFVWIGIITLVVLGMSFVVLKYSFPSLLTRSDLFQPEVLASRYFPSLGSMIVFSISALTLAALYYLYARLEDIRSRQVKRMVSLLLFASAALLLLFIDQLISVLILDSSISFEAHRVTTFSGYTVAGLFVIIIWFVILGLVLDKAIVLGSSSSEHVLLSGSIAVSMVMAGALVLPGTYGSWTSWVAILLLLGGHLYLRYQHGVRIPFSRYIFSSLIYFRFYDPSPAAV